MSTANKYMQSASGAGGDALNVEDVFSTYLYIGNGSTQTITNGIDLDGEGGLVWIKSRSHSYPHNLYDTERGATKRLKSASTVAESTLSTGLTAFSSTGFTLGGDNDTNGTYSDAQYASWTFRKAKKFFDVVTYTGSDSTQTINHSLASEVGFMVVKRVSSGAGQWYAHHRSLTSGHIIKLNSTDASTSNASSLLYNVTSTSFTVDAGAYHTNAAGETYVAYLWAHNNNDGDFGPDADQDIIKCGSVSYPASGDVEVNLGFEPQWVLYKDVTHSGNNWWILDTMRGWNAQETGGTFSSTTGGKAEALFSNTTGAEVEYDYGALTSTGFKLPSNFNYGDNNTDFIYIAIRRGTKVPESGTEVFGMDYQGNGTTDPAYVSGFVTDFGLRYYLPGGASAYPISGSRLTGTNRLTTSSTSAQVSQSSLTWDYMNGWYNPDSNSTNVFTHMWKRAPNYMDVVAFTGTGSAGTHNHNLTVPPEMMWVKSRAGNSNWFVYHSGLGATKYLFLNETSAAGTASSVWNDTAPTSSVFSVGASVNQASASIAYLFASLDGISKVGSYTGNGSTLNIDCGFTSGARFVLIKAVTTSGSWYVLDTARGIVAGNDPVLSLNTTDAEEAYDDLIDPYSAGFTLNGVGMVNANTVNYIFYAIA